MFLLSVLSVAFSFVFLSGSASCRAAGVADHYSLWLSDTSLVVRAETGEMVSMEFPATRPAICADGRNVKYPSVFPNIDLVIYRSPIYKNPIYRNDAGFEYDWRVAPFANASQIEVSFSGARYERIGPDGDLILGLVDGEVRHGRPVAYQEVDGGRRTVAAAFEIAGDGRVRFRLGRYNHSRPLVIDPALSFVTGIGGSGISVGIFRPYFYGDLASGMALDGSGNIYIAGLTYSQDFPLVNSFSLSFSAAPVLADYASCAPSFVAKLSPDGKTILYSTLLTGCSLSPPSIALDTSGNAYVAGSVENANPFVQVGGGTTTPSTDDAFLAKLSANGALAAAIVFGGSGISAATSIALGPDGKLNVTGTTSSTDFPVTPGALAGALSSSQDVFLMKLDPTLLTGNQLSSNAVLYSTYLGQGSSPIVVADATGNAYVAASTTSTAWVATPGVFQSHCWDASREGCADVIVTKVNPSASQFIYTTYLGGSLTDTIGGLAIDGSGDAYLTGTTNSFDFPTTSQNYFQGDAAQTAFAVKLSPDASHLVYGTLLGTGQTTGAAIAVDSSGNTWVGGGTNDTTFPIQSGIQQTLFNAVCFSYFDPSSMVPDGEYYCPQAGYLAELNPSGTALTWATYLGDGSVNSIVLDQSGDLFAAGGQLAMSSAAAAPSKNNSASVVKISLAGTSISNVFVDNAAGFQSGLPAAGGLASMFADIPVTGTVSATELPLPIELAGVTVSVDGIPAPILAVANSANSPHTQVNFQVPFEIGAGDQAHIVEVQYAGQSAFVVPQEAGPGIFTLPSGAGVIQHASDYSLVTDQNPVKPGETLIIYASGLGAVTTPVPTGSAATQADPVTPCNVPTISLGTVLYAGLTPGFPGLYQVNVQLPPYLSAGVTYVSLSTNACWAFPPPQNVATGNLIGLLITN
jgi:uncharacterized protein (TIGR03437 family)